MRYELPPAVRQVLATRGHRLHHLLWHVIRDSWHGFSQAERDELVAKHPRWVPSHARFAQVNPTPENPRGIEVNFGAGESFLYMHRQMIAAVNAQLLAIGEPVLVPWIEIPGPDDSDYPVPGRTKDGAADDVKSDAFGDALRELSLEVLDPQVLRQNSLAAIGAFVESFIHDPLHGRWAAQQPAWVDEFPPIAANDVAPDIDAKFDPPDIDWLGSPWSSHVNSDFWKLHGWCDQVVEAWRVANGQAAIAWTDTWQGDMPAAAELTAGPGLLGIDRLKRLHGHFEHGHHTEHELMGVVATISRFKECVVGFDYVRKQRVPLRLLAGMASQR